EARHFGARLLDRHTRLEPRDDGVVVEHAVTLPLERQERHGDEHVGRLALHLRATWGGDKPSRADPDHGVRPAGELNRSADEGRVAPEGARPESVADDRDAGDLLILCGGEKAALSRFGSEN